MLTLRRYWPTIPLAMLFALAVFFEWSSANAPRPNAQDNSGQQTSNRPINNNPAILFTVGTWIGDNHDGIEAAAAILSVVFTFFLVGSNVLLWSVTRVAANAAKQAAESLLIVERAYVYPVIVGHGAIGDCIEVARASNEDEVPQPMTAELTFKFKNFGKTPAILKTAFAGVGVAPLGARIGLPLVESVLGTGEETVTPLISEMQVGITRRQAQHIIAYTGHICFEGEVTFDDIWGNEHTTEFYFVWDHWISRMNLRWAGTKTKQKGEKPKNGG